MWGGGGRIFRPRCRTTSVFVVSFPASRTLGANAPALKFTSPAPLTAAASRRLALSCPRLHRTAGKGYRPPANSIPLSSGPEGAVSQPHGRGRRHWHGSDAEVAHEPCSHRERLFPADLTSPERLSLLVPRLSGRRFAPGGSRIRRSSPVVKKVRFSLYSLLIW